MKDCGSTKSAKNAKEIEEELNLKEGYIKPWK